jgi:UDP-3-O-[3-hydroxymyristoyl] glucosamine N-acyltransferase
MKNNDKQISAAKMAEKLGAKLKGNKDIVITGVAALAEASFEDISFLANKKYQHQVADSFAGTVIVGQDFDGELKENHALLVCEDPNLAFSKAIEFFAPDPIKFKPGIHPSAVVYETAVIGKNVSIGPNAVIDEYAEIGDNSVIGAGTYIGQMSKVGTDCLIYANVSIRERCVIGDRVIIHPGTTIGSDGFGFSAGPTGIIKIAQIGTVQIDNDVEIGANCAIDRARFGKTWLKRGVKLDNIVHVAHNVEVDEFAMLIGQCGIAGSTKIGKGAIIAAQAGINGHITIGAGAKVAGTSGVVKDVPPGGQVVGTPAETPREFIERLSAPKKISKLSQKVKELENELKSLKELLAQQGK